MKLEAMHNFVILKVNEREKKKGTIHLPDSAAQGNEDFAEVVSVGPLCDSVRMGDVVLCPEAGDYEWTDENDDYQLYYMVEEHTIPAKVKICD
jgi:co-chaperonin GroES (HSP10)